LMASWLLLPAHAFTMASPQRVKLDELLSTCVDASLRGCAEIRRVQAQRVSGGAAALTIMEAKDEQELAGQYLTEADLAAQAAIVAALQNAWPGVHIIGEEDDSAPSLRPDDVPSLRRDLCPELAGAASVALDAVTIFVDPLDGTREYVEERLANVQSLVGVAVGGRSVAGAIGLPFPAGDLGADAAAVYGLAGAGAGAVGARPESCRDASLAAPIVTTGDSKNPLLAAAKTVALEDGGTAVCVGGAGTKILSVAEGACDLAVMHFGTSLWDTAAPEAVIRARGGRVSDLFGAPLCHMGSPPSGSLKNALGVIASAPGMSDAHDRLCARMRADPLALALLAPTAGEGERTVAEAVDVARCLDGAPLQLRWLDDALGGGGGLGRFDAPESGAFRGMMSVGCRLQLRWKDDDDAGGARPRSAFYKRVVMGDLEAVRAKALAAPLKLARDVNSYRVEAAFLASAACRELVAAGVAAPVAHAVDLRPSADDPVESRFSLLLSDFSPDDGWGQRSLLSEGEARASLTALAKLHAYFWAGSSFWQRGGAAAAEVEAAVWPAGCYWQPSMQPDDQWSALADKCDAHVAKFGAPFAAELAGVDLAAIGRRLQSVARAAAAAAHPFDSAAGASDDERARAERFKTIVHGDPKSANLFLREGADGALEVGMIDFQWLGFGLAATDVAHHVVGSIAADALASEAALLDHYHSALCQGLVAFGAAADADDAAARVMPRSELQSQYETGVLDMCRMVFAYQWGRADFATPSHNKNAYNKSLKNAAWLVRRCDALLKGRGA